ncbi:MAG TPA: FHA domain-containing protein [Solirubrobacteraceae bacterium]|jgi:hypothetical protein|nr:FHA domain-containing protein [Solirubrobacteraceae bacterium]
MSRDDPHRAHASTPAELKAVADMTRSGCVFVTWRVATGLNLRALDPGVARTTIGRSPSSAIILSDSAASWLHAEITRIDEEWLIVDDGLSTNGTFVDGRRIHGRARLRNRDRIVIGDTVIVFHLPGERLAPTKRLGAHIARTDLGDTEFDVLKALCRPIVVDGGRVTATNEAIRAEVHMTLSGVKRCLTRLFALYGIDRRASSKRLLLAQAAVRSGVVGPRTYV